MQKLYILAGAAILGSMILGTTAALWLRPAKDELAECRGTVIAGGAIGGPFTLVDTEGREVSEAQVLTKPALIYFGYGFCPDVCPLDNARNAMVAESLAAKGRDLVPVFISVDPKRDTPQALKDYVANISPLMVALTGSPAQIQAAAKAYKVYFNVPASDDPYYMVDHTTLSYLHLPGLGVVDVFERELSSEAAEQRVSCYLDKTGA